MQVGAETQPKATLRKVSSKKPAPLDPVDLAKRLLLARRKRLEAFGPTLAGMMGEPAYDLLLDLYVAYRETRAMDISSACIGGSVPPTTGLRYLGRLEAAGAVVLESDIRDTRRRLVSLTAETAKAIERHLMTLNL